MASRSFSSPKGSRTMSGMNATIPRTAPAQRLRGSRIALGALPSAVPCARAYTRAVLATWDVSGVIGNAEVVVTELVTNAVTHGSQGRESGPIPVIQLDLLLARALVIDVWDGSPEPPVMRPGDPLDTETGRGLLLVSALCATWRTDVIAGWPGKRVRAVLPIG